MHMELQVGVKVLLKNPEGRYVLIRRADGKYQEVQNRWDIPGGRIEPSLGLRENLAREVMEETALTMTSDPRHRRAGYFRSGARQAHRACYLQRYRRRGAAAVG